MKLKILLLCGLWVVLPLQAQQAGENPPGINFEWDIIKPEPMPVIFDEAMKPASPPVIIKPEPLVISSGKTYTETATGVDIEMVWVKGGSFKMGSNDYDSQKPVHEVTVKGFYLGKTEVTFAQWHVCKQAGACPHAEDKGWGRGDRPVINVSWNDVQKYLGWLKQQTGKAYRLPSEAEWEYAARAGTTTAYSWGDSVGKNKANCDGCGSQWDGKSTAPVGSFGANEWGLSDMHGNVWEWCADDWHDNYDGAPTDGSVWASNGANRVLRGGSWNNYPQDAQAADRHGLTPDNRDHYLGFRLVLGAPGQK